MSRDESQPRRRPRPVEPARLPPGPLKDLKDALYELYLLIEQPTLDELAAEVARLADELDLPGVPKRDTIARIIGSSDVPANSADLSTVAAVLAHTAGRDVPTVVGQIRQLWVRARMMAPPLGAVRVRDARPRLLGVHAAIHVDGADGELPPYVPRDLDADLRTTLTAAAASGGFLLMIGGSSVGKTRALFEAVRAVGAEWWLFHPADTPTLIKFAEQSTQRTVVWLDEFQRYLSHPGKLPVGAMRALIASGVVVVATMWPDEYNVRTASRSPDRPDPHANDRELLNLAHVVQVPETFSDAERHRAEALVAADTRVRIALNSPDAGFTQVLAAGPELVRWWNQAPADQCYGKAIITAALDARRVGATAPLTRHLLAAAAPGYLTPAQQATAPAGWFDQALAYATTRLHGAASALAPVPLRMGRTIGYTVADYLHQHALRARRTVALPNVVWQALVDYHHRHDTASLADNAVRRGRPNEAISLYRIAAVPDGHSEHWRAELAAYQLAKLLTDRGQIDEAIEILRPLRGGHAPQLLIRLLAKQGQVDELRARADGGDRYAASQLGELLAGRGQLDEAIEVLRARPNAGSRSADDLLISLLAEKGRLDEAIEMHRLGVHAPPLLTVLLVKHGHIDELRARAHAGNWDAASRLAEQGRLDEAIEVVRARPNAALGSTDFMLINLLAKHDRVDEAIELLRAHVAADVDVDNWNPDSRYAAGRLAELLAGQGRLDEAIEMPQAFAIADHLAWLLKEHGRVDEAIQMMRVCSADAGSWNADYMLAWLLAEHGQVDEAIEILRARADAGDDSSQQEALAELLAEHGRVDELIAEVAAGTPGATVALQRIIGQRDASSPSPPA